MRSNGQMTVAEAAIDCAPDTLYRQLIESVTDYAILTLDPDGRVLSWNEGAERIKGYTADEIIGQSFTRFYPPEVLASGFPQHELDVAAREGRFEDENWRVRKDGSRFWANVVITALRDADGRLVGFGKVTRDLTARRQADEELRQSEERFRLIVHGVQDYAILMLDREGRVVSWNEGAQRIKGYTADEIIGQSFTRFYPPDRIASGLPQHALEVAARDGRFEDEGWRVRHDGSRFWANVIITALHDADGKLIGFGKVTRDLTARREAEEQARRLAAEEAAHAQALRNNEQLEQQNEEIRRLAAQVQAANAELERSLAAEQHARDSAERSAAAAIDAYHDLDQFAYVASHDLKAPLRAIANLSTWIEEDAAESLDPKSAEHFRLLQGRVHRMEALIDGILQYSRAGRRLTPSETVDTGALVREAIQMLAPPPEVCIDVQERLPTVQAERVPLQQVFMNLIGNAVKYAGAARPDVAIQVGCRDLGEAFEFAVSDNGPGIAPEYHERIWGVFQTLEARDKVEGTGIGLSVVKRVIESRGGTVSVESTPGQGAIFRFVWPKAPLGEIG